MYKFHVVFVVFLISIVLARADVLSFKWLTVPETNATKQVEAVQLWEVRWKSRHGEYYSDTRPEI